MENYNSHQQWHKNILKKEEEIFLMVVFFVIGWVFLFTSISMDHDTPSQITSLSASYRQFSIVERAYASKNH